MTNNIIRIVHNRENPYAPLSKETINDENLTPALLGIWTRCMSRPNNWEFNMLELARSFKINKDTMYKYIKQLIQMGYVIHYRTLDDKNRFNKSVYIFFEFKVSEKDRKEFLEDVSKQVKLAPLPKISDTDLSDTKNPEYTKYIKRLNTKITKSSSPSYSPKSKKNPSIFSCLPKSETPHNINYQDILRQEFGDKMDEIDFSKVFKRMKERPKSSIENLVTYGRKSCRNLIEAKNFGTDKSAEIEQHRSQAKALEKKLGKTFVEAGEKYVEFKAGIQSDQLLYDLKASEWSEKFDFFCQRITKFASRNTNKTMRQVPASKNTGT